MPARTFAIIVGRTNVGKSTLFNRLLQRTQAIVSHQPGTTRDQNFGQVEWHGKKFWLADTGGFDLELTDDTNKASQKMLRRALPQAKMVLFVIDGQTDITAEERNLARQLHRLRKPVILVINKIDNSHQRQNFSNSNLGFTNTIMISAKNGSGVGDLLDLMMAQLEPSPNPEPKLKLALLGKTNVGKSSLFNKLLQDERSLVLPTPHTTRDRLHDFLEYGETTLELIDTAGIRRQLIKAPTLEQKSVEQSLSVLENIDTALLVIDGGKEITWQDQRIGDLIMEAGIACLILINKSDLLPFDKRKAFIKHLKNWLPMLAWAENIFVSAKTGEGINNIITQAENAAQEWNKQLSDSQIKYFANFLKRTKPTRELPLSTLKQTNTKPPTFNLQIQTKETLPKSLNKWIEGKIRRLYGFKGTPVRINLAGLRKK